MKIKIRPYKKYQQEKLGEGIYANIECREDIDRAYETAVSRNHKSLYLYLQDLNFMPYIFALIGETSYEKDR